MESRFGRSTKDIQLIHEKGFVCSRDKNWKIILRFLLYFSYTENINATDFIRQKMVRKPIFDIFTGLVCI